MNEERLFLTEAGVTTGNSFVPDDSYRMEKDPRTKLGLLVIGYRGNRLAREPYFRRRLRLEPAWGFPNRFAFWLHAVDTDELHHCPKRQPSDLRRLQKLHASFR
jgi:hypothetical protein